MTFSLVDVENCGLPDSFLRQLQDLYADTSAGTDALVRMLKSPPSLEEKPTPHSHHTEVYAEGPDFLRIRNRGVYFEIDLRTGDAEAYVSSDAEHIGRFFTRMMNAIISARAILKGGFTIHSSAVSAGNAGYLFFGPSGIGKSTAASMLCPPCTLINDDVNVIVRDGDRCRVAGLPFKMDQMFPAVPPVELRGMYALRQSESTRLETGAMQQIVAEILQSCYHLTCSQCLTTQLLANVVNANAQLGIGILHFTLTADLCETIPKLKEAVACNT